MCVCWMGSGLFICIRMKKGKCKENFIYKFKYEIIIRINGIWFVELFFLYEDGGLDISKVCVIVCYVCIYLNLLVWWMK